MQLPRGPAPRLLKEGFASHQGLVLWILGIICFLQVAFHFTANSALRGEKEDVWAMCADGSHGDSSSLQCAEVQLFRSWQHAPETDEALLRVTPRSPAEEEVTDNTPQHPKQDSTTSPSEAASTASTSQPLSESSTEQAPEQPPEKPMVDISVQQVESSGVTEWAQGLIDLQAGYQSKLSSLLDHHKQLHPVAAERAKPLLEQIMDVGRQMCSDPDHRSRPECADFLKPEVLNISNASLSGHGHTAAAHADPSSSSKMAELNERLHELEESEHAWEKAFSDKAHSLARELCRDPSRKGYAACAEFVNQETTPAPVARAALRGSPERRPSGDLHWSTVVGWKGIGSGLRGSSQPPVLAESELRHAHWKGTIPKVACVAVLPCGRLVKPWMKYFIDNFNMQHYEGPRQLIIVYHHKHTEAARAVKMYADGTFIKAVAARDPDYPSASTFRFGAWSTDAEVIARWDFDAYHNRQRLSMQVRALAYAERPASLLREWSVRTQSGELRVVSGGRNWDSSLVGEAAWMRENWYPSMEEGREALEATVAQQAVHVNASDLSVYDEATHEMAAERCHFDSQ